MAAPPTYRLDRHFFHSIDSEAKAYWLGFITADGSVGKASGSWWLRVALQRRDRDHLFKLRAALSATAPVTDRRRPNSKSKGGVQLYSDFMVYGGELVGDLGGLGIVPNKSLVVEPWHGPNDLMPHYWRGLFDGDGCLHRGRDGRWTLFLVGSMPVVTAFGEFVRSRLGWKATAKPKGKYGYIRYTGRRLPGRIAELIYGSASVALDRKAALAEQLLSESPDRWAREPRQNRSGLTREDLVGLASRLGTKKAVAAELKMKPVSVGQDRAERPTSPASRPGSGSG